MRAFFRTLINLALIAGVIWLVARYTTLDDKLIAWVRSLSTGTKTTITSCDTPRGVKIPNGSSVFAYEDGMPDAAGKCHEERRTCVKGVLQGTFTYPQCTETNDGTGTNATGGIAPTGASCTTPWGQSVAHGNYMVAYESPSSCRFQRRMCVDGQLLGKFNYNYCMIGYAGGVGANGGQAQYDSIYATDDANLAGQGGNGGVNARDFSNSIYGESPYAANGGWHYANVQYGGGNANAQLPADYWNQNAKGNVVVVNSQNDPKLNPHATNGKPNPYGGAKDRNNNTTNYDLTMKGCQSPWGTHVDNGQFVIAYRASVATKGGSCEYERRTCMNGKLNGSFAFNSCGGKDSKARQYGNEGLDNYYRVEQQPTMTQSHRSCRTPWGAAVKDGDYVRAYKYASSPRSEGCEGEVRYCRNGQLDGSYSNKSCALTTPTYPGCYGWNCGNNGYHDDDCYGNNCGNNNNGCHGDHCGGPTYNNACSLPWGGNISNGQYVTAWTLINGNCYSEQRLCSNGYLNGSYSMQSCTPTVVNPQYADCRTPRGGIVKHGNSVEAFASPTAPCTKEIRRCYNGTLNGSFQYQYCNTGNPGPGTTAGTDTYGSWTSLGWMNSTPHEMDTCQGDAVVTFVCTPQDRITCVDVRKVEDDCCIANRAKYEKRVVTCTN